MKRVRVAAPILAGVILTLTSAPAFAATEAASVYAETPADALARNVRIVADSPRDFNALIGAGRAALQVGDPMAAVGFFGRAQEVNPMSPLPQAGLGAALVANGDPNGALACFTRARQLGASAVSIGADRGLAYDLLGNQAAAQTDYRAALLGPDRDEARRRLALSLAISGNEPLALTTLEPLLQRRDLATQRVRALVLALGGDLVSAKAALDSTMPGASIRMDPFFRRLPALSPVQKAAAVHLGIFPDSGSAMASNGLSGGDRLASIDQLLTAASEEPQPAQYNYAAPAPTVARRQAPVRLASVSRPSIQRATSPSNDLIQTERVAGDSGGRKIWLQIASGANPAELPQEFKRIRSKKPALFTGLSGYVADGGSRARLLIGPFHTREDAILFSDALSSARIDSFEWTSKPGQVVRKLPTQ